MIDIAGRVRPASAAADVEVLTVLTALRAPARRIRALQTGAADHARAIQAILRSWRPDLLNLAGVGPIVAAVVLTAWSHPGRCRSDAAFAMLAGTAPIPASSGKTVRYRLNRSATANSTGPRTPSRCPASSTTPTPATTPTSVAHKARPTGRSHAASSATSPASSTANSRTRPAQQPPLLDEP
jgi:hypothetical protein